MISDAELRYAVALSLLSGIGPIRFTTLFGVFKKYESIFNADSQTLYKFGLSTKVVQALKSVELLDAAERELNFCQKKGIQVLPKYSSDYPTKLNHLRDAPIVLFYKGNVSLNERLFLGVIGTRTPSNYGIALTKQLIEEFKSYNPVILSGLAYGVDICAHDSALEYNMDSVACVAHGLNTIYPVAHRSTAIKMVNQGGIISEYPSQLPTRKQYFARRNRIVAALSDALIVVESKKKGGSLITAQKAYEYYKPIFALPGRVGDINSEGCNNLILNGQAQIFTSSNDVAKRLNWSCRFNTPSTKSVQNKLFESLEADELEIVKLLSASSSTFTIDELIATLNKSNQQIASSLLTLEFKDLIKTLPGKRYVLQ